jgi:phosphoadenosine phosphosulfate reductase
MGRFEETIELLKSQNTDSVLVGYSGGKDSMVVLDLCMRAFKRVEAFHLYLVPGLECVEIALAEARARYGIPIHQYPHFIVRWFLTEGCFCPNHYKQDSLPQWKMKDIYDLASYDTGIELIATGAKRSDSVTRRRRVGKMKRVLNPIASWLKADVMGYMKFRGLPLPSSSNRATTGIDLSAPNLLWLYDTYPADFARIEKVFPYVGAVVKRREWYGIAS